MLFLLKILWDTLTDAGTFWTAFSAIATAAAVGVSLHLASQSNRPRRKLEIRTMYTYQYDEGRVIYTVTIDNIGNRNITLLSYGFNNNGVIEITYNNYAKQPVPFNIKAGDAMLIQYVYPVGRQFTDKEIGELSQEHRIVYFFRNCPFVVMDSTNKLWHEKND